jgi:hypothetical protein
VAKQIGPDGNAPKGGAEPGAPDGIIDANQLMLTQMLQF